MPQFQIRTSEKMSVEDVIREMAFKGWHGIQEFFDTSSITVEDYMYFQEQVRHIVNPYLKAYDLCGTANECSDDVEGAPWLDYSDHIYHLATPQGLDAFLENLSFESLETIKHHLKPHSKRNVFAKLQQIFRQTLNQYLYFNPACHKIELCLASVPVSPWGRL